MMDDTALGEGEVVFDRERARTLRGALTQAYAAGREAGDTAMLAAGRTAWSEDDYNAACAAFERVLRSAADAAQARAPDDGGTDPDEERASSPPTFT